MQNNQRLIKEITETYPEVIRITNSWLQIAMGHGYSQDQIEKEVLTKFSDAMKQLTKRRNRNAE